MVNRLVAVDDDFNLPPEVQAQLTGKFEAEFQTAHDEAVDAATAAQASETAAANSEAEAAISAQEAQDAAATATAPTDQAVDEGIERAVEASKVAPGVDLISDLLASPGTTFIAHRGGGRIYPENTMAGYRAAVRTGFIPEMDIYRLSTGELVTCHDATTGRTMTGPDTTISTMTLDDWLTRQVNSPWPGGKAEPPALFEDVLNEFGGRRIILAEIKDSAATNQVIEAVLSRGLGKSVILQSFSWATAQQIQDAGITAKFLCGSTTSITPTQMVDAGVMFLGPSKNMSQTTMATYQAEGIDVTAYGAVTVADWEDLQAKGVDGASFDDPWGILDRYAKQTRDPFHTSEAFYGWDATPESPTVQQAVNYTGPQGTLRLDGIVNGESVCAMRQSWAKPAVFETGYPVNLRFRTGWNRLTGTGSGYWLAAFLGVTDNHEAYRHTLTGGTVGQYGYLFTMYRDGTMRIHRVNDNASSTQIANLSTGTPFGSDQYNEVNFEIKISSTMVYFLNIDTNDIVSAADSVHRPSEGFELHFAVWNTQVDVSDISFAAIPASAQGL